MKSKVSKDHKNNPLTGLVEEKVMWNHQGNYGPTEVSDVFFFEGESNMLSKRYDEICKFSQIGEKLLKIEKVIGCYFLRTFSLLHDLEYITNKNLCIYIENLSWAQLRKGRRILS